MVKLCAWPDGDRLVVVGSWAGAARDPGWVHNLRADGRATVQVAMTASTVRATEVDGTERDVLWRLVCDAYPLYAAYQRRIPLFAFERDAH